MFDIGKSRYPVCFPEKEKPRNTQNTRRPLSFVYFVCFVVQFCVPLRFRTGKVHKQDNRIYRIRFQMFDIGKSRYPVCFPEKEKPRNTQNTRRLHSFVYFVCFVVQCGAFSGLNRSKAPQQKKPGTRRSKRSVLDLLHILQVGLSLVGTEVQSHFGLILAFFVHSNGVGAGSVSPIAEILVLKRLAVGSGQLQVRHDFFFAVAGSP